MDTESGDNTEEHSFMGLLSVFSRKWTLLVITATGNFEGVRFNELRRELGGISPKTLSNTIKELVKAGILETVKYPGPPLMIRYFLSEEGIALRASILPIIKWLCEKSSHCDSLAVRHALNFWNLDPEAG